MPGAAFRCPRASLSPLTVAPGGPGKATRAISHHDPVPPPLHHLTGTYSNTLQMNFLIDRHLKKKKKNNQMKTINILFFLLISTDNETNRKINCPDPKPRIKVQQK